MSGGGGLGLDGGMAEYLLVPAERLLARLPDGLQPATAAALTDAGLTPYHAIRRSWSKMAPTSTVVVIGVGGLGHIAVQLVTAATTAAKVIAVDNRQQALDLATKVGADHVVTSDDQAAGAVKDLTGGHGADVLLDFVGAEATIELARTAARPLGDATIVGIAGGSVPLSFFSQPFEVSIQTTYWGSRPELVQLLDLAARGLVHVESTTYALDDAAQAYRDLHDGKVHGRAIVVPSPHPTCRRRGFPVGSLACGSIREPTLPNAVSTSIATTRSRSANGVMTSARARQRLPAAWPACCCGAGSSCAYVCLDAALNLCCSRTPPAPIAHNVWSPVAFVASTKYPLYRSTPG